MDKKAKKNSSKGSKANIVIAVQIVIIIVLATALGILAGKGPHIITNFEDCDAMTGSITTESNGRRVCLINNDKFYEDNMEDYSTDDQPIQVMTPAEEAYMGLTEEAAIAKAEGLNVPVRILERDGQFFPMTMDLVDGRVNLTINNNKVTAVQIEDMQAVEEDE